MNFTLLQEWCVISSIKFDLFHVLINFQVNLSWKNEGAKKVQFRADYRRVVRNEMAEYRTVYVDVVYVKTDLPLQLIHLSPDNRDGDTYQNFTVQTFGKSIEILFCFHFRRR